MANIESAEAVRRLSASQIGKMTNPQLKDALLKLVSAESPSEPTNSTILQEIRSLRAEVQEIKNLKQEVATISQRCNDMQCQIDKQAAVIGKQQNYLEMLDRKERERNLVFLGIPEEPEVLEEATTDDEKVRKILDLVGISRNGVISQRRLGRSDNNQAGPRRKNCPILVIVESKAERDNILDKAKVLKNAGDVFRRIFIKKDVHPSVRNEWQRLRNVEKKEKERPENVGCVVYLDTQQRKVFRDGVVIDSWNPHFL